MHRVWLTWGAVRRGDEEMAAEVRACSRAGLEGGSEFGLCRWPGLNGGSECGLWDPSLSLPWLLGGVGGNLRCSSAGNRAIILKHLKHLWLLLICGRNNWALNDPFWFHMALIPQICLAVTILNIRHISDLKNRKNKFDLILCHSKPVWCFLH